MTKWTKILTLLILITFMISCQKDSSSKDDVVSISIDSSLLSHIYTTDTLYENLYITILHKNGESSTILVNESMFDQASKEKLLIPGHHNLTLMYGQKEFSFQVFIKHGNLESKIVAIYHQINHPDFISLSLDDFKTFIQNKATERFAEILDVNLNQDGFLELKLSHDTYISHVALYTDYPVNIYITDDMLSSLYNVHTLYSDLVITIEYYSGRTEQLSLHDVDVDIPILLTLGHAGLYNLTISYIDLDFTFTAKLKSNDFDSKLLTYYQFATGNLYYQGTLSDFEDFLSSQMIGDDVDMLDINHNEDGTLSILTSQPEIIICSDLIGFVFDTTVLSISMTETTLNRTYDSINVFDELSLVVHYANGLVHHIPINRGMLSIEHQQKLSEMGAHDIEITHMNQSSIFKIMIHSHDLSSKLSSYYRFANNYLNLSLTEPQFIESIHQEASFHDSHALDVSIDEEGHLVIYLSNDQHVIHQTIAGFTEENYHQFLSLSQTKQVIKNADYTPNITKKMNMVKPISSSNLSNQSSRNLMLHMVPVNQLSSTVHDSMTEHGYDNYITPSQYLNLSEDFASYFTRNILNYGRDIRKQVDSTLANIHYLDEWVGSTNSRFSMKTKISYDVESMIYTLEFFIPYRETFNTGIITHDGVLHSRIGEIDGYYELIHVWYDELGREIIEVQQMKNLIWDESSTYFDGPIAKYTKDERAVKYMKFIDGYSYEYFERDYLGYKKFGKLTKENGQFELYSLTAGDDFNAYGSYVEKIGDNYLEISDNRYVVYNSELKGALHGSAPTSYYPYHGFYISLDNLDGWLALGADIIDDYARIGLLTQTGLFENTFQFNYTGEPIEHIRITDHVYITINVGGYSNVSTGEYRIIFNSSSLGFRVEANDLLEARHYLFDALSILGLSFKMGNDVIESITGDVISNLYEMLNSIEFYDIPGFLTYNGDYVLAYYRSFIEITYDDVLNSRNVRPTKWIATDDFGNYLEKIGLSIEHSGYIYQNEQHLMLDQLVFEIKDSNTLFDSQEYHVVIALKYNHLILMIQHELITSIESPYSMSSHLDLLRISQIHLPYVENYELVAYIAQNVQGQLIRVSDYIPLTFGDSSVHIDLLNVYDYHMLFISNPIKTNVVVIKPTE